MSLPEPDQVSEYPTIHTHLTNWLWSRPEGGVYKPPTGRVVSGPLLTRMVQELNEAGWHTELEGLEDGPDGPVIRIRPMIRRRSRA